MIQVMIQVMLDEIWMKFGWVSWWVSCWILIASTTHNDSSQFGSIWIWLLTNDSILHQWTAPAVACHNDHSSMTASKGSWGPDARVVFWLPQRFHFVKYDFHDAAKSNESERHSGFGAHYLNDFLMPYQECARASWKLCCKNGAVFWGWCKKQKVAWHCQLRVYMSIYLLTSEPAALFQWPSTIVSSNKCKRLGPQRRQFLWKRAREMPATVREKQHDKNYPPHPATHQPELVPLLQVPNEGLYNTTIYHYIT